MAINKNVENFACSNEWIANFCRRNRISSRKITHQGQEDNVPKGEMYLKVKHFLDEVTIKAAGIPAENIFNMDETPCFFDMANSRTLHFTGEKTVDGLDTGHSKNRFTTVLCISASGKFIKSLIIFKGLKKNPKVKLPKNVDITVSTGGSMNGAIMLQWAKTCFSKRGNSIMQQKSLLSPKH